MEAMHHLLLCLLVVLTTGFSPASSSREYYTAAVYEHARLEDQSPDTQVQTNLKWYERATTLAKKQGADLILFPETGLYFPPSDRKEVKGFLENIPNPKEVKVNPCNQPALFSERPVLLSLSCMAKRNKIVLVANMGGKERCQGQPDCPEDGDFHYNANVAFDENGTLVGRYYKEHLYFESAMDVPREKQDPTFKTDLGKFAMFICFDIVFEKMAVTSRLADVDAVLFSTMWMSSLPFFTATPWFQAFAMGNNATLLASNVQIPRYLAAGSGIFKGREGPIASTLNLDGVSKLIVAAIPKGNKSNLPSPQITALYENSTKAWLNEDDGKILPSTFSYPILGKNDKILKKLDKASDSMKVCSNGVCCELDYAANSMNESFYLGVYSGIHDVFDKYFWSEENCFLARCDDVNETACTSFPTKSETVFKKVILRANFKSRFVYPWLVSSRIRLVPVKNWKYEVENSKQSIKFANSPGIQLLVAGLKGRAYDKDPPYTK